MLKVIKAPRELKHMQRDIFQISKYLDVSLTCMYIQTHLFFLFVQWFLFGLWGWQYFQKDNSEASSVLWHRWLPPLCEPLLLSAEIKALP